MKESELKQDTLNRLQRQEKEKEEVRIKEDQQRRSIVNMREQSRKEYQDRVELMEKGNL
jgi:hypothetical protein